MRRKATYPETTAHDFVLAFVTTSWVLTFRLASNIIRCHQDKSSYLRDTTLD
jgi:hypothetical protein